MNKLKYSEEIQVAGKHIFVVHQIDKLAFDPGSGGMDIVVFGHTHQPLIKYKKKVLYLNPGSIGPKRLKLPVTMAYVEINDGKINPVIVPIE